MHAIITKSYLFKHLDAVPESLFPMLKQLDPFPIILLESYRIAHLPPDFRELTTHLLLLFLFILDTFTVQGLHLVTWGYLLPPSVTPET